MDQEWRVKLCQEWGLENELVDVANNPYEAYNRMLTQAEYRYTTLQAPAHVGQVLGDGNCFYRALSHLITGGSENVYEKLRALVRTVAPVISLTYPPTPPPFEGPSNVISILFTMARDQGIHSNALESNNFFVRSLRNTSGHSCLGTKTMNNTKNSHQCTNGITCIYSALSFCLFRVINMLTASFLDV